MVRRLWICLNGTMGFFTGTMHIPAPLAFLAICAEFFGGMGLMIGFLTRIAAFGIATNMVVAIATVHRHFGFFMNWNGNQKGERDSNFICWCWRSRPSSSSEEQEPFPWTTLSQQKRRGVKWSENDERDNR